MEKNNSITVFGATGNIGAHLIELLAKANIETVAVTRNIENATGPAGIKWVQADMADKQSLYAAMQNSTSVFLLSGQGPDFVEEQQNVIDVAKQLGVTRMVKLSSGAADATSAFYIPRTHGEVEDHLISSGIYYTMLRPNGIMQNWLGDIAESVRKERRFYESTGDGKRAHVDCRDIAEVAFKCLTEPQNHYNKVYLLTGDKAVNYYDVAGAISAEIGETVEYVSITLNEARRAMEKTGMPHALIDTFVAYDEAQQKGEAATVSAAVKTILGKPARTLEGFVHDYADSFR